MKTLANGEIEMLTGEKTPLQKNYKSIRRTKSPSITDINFN